MRKITSSLDGHHYAGNYVWVSTDPEPWKEYSIGKVLKHILPAQSTPPTGNSVHYAGIWDKVQTGAEWFVCLGAAYQPNASETLTIESVVSSVTDPSSGQYFPEEHVAIIFEEAIRLLTLNPVLNSGILRFDRGTLHPVDYSVLKWRLATRALIGLLSIPKYDVLSDEEILAAMKRIAQ